MVLLRYPFQSLRLPAPGPKINLPILSSVSSNLLWDDVFYQFVPHLPAAGAISKRLPTKKDRHTHAEREREREIEIEIITK